MNKCEMIHVHPGDGSGEEEICIKDAVYLCKGINVCSPCALGILAEEPSWISLFTYLGDVTQNRKEWGGERPDSFKISQRLLLEVGGEPAFLLRESELPDLADTQTVITLYSYCIPSASQEVMKWIETSTKSKVRKDITLKVMNRLGEIINYMEIRGCWIDSDSYNDENFDIYLNICWTEGSASLVGKGIF